MSTIPVNRLGSQRLESDREDLVGLQIYPDYAPRNPGYSVAELTALAAELAAAEQEELRLQIALAAARNRAIAAGHAFHEGMIGARNEVVVQYGADSSAVEAVGLKRKSARRRPQRRSAVG